MIAYWLLSGDGLPEKHQEHKPIERREYLPDIRCGFVIMSWGNSLEDKTLGACRWRVRVEDDGRELWGRTGRQGL